MKHKLISLFIFCFILLTSAESQKIKALNTLVEKAKTAGGSFAETKLFSFQKSGIVQGKGIYHELNINESEINKLLLTKPATITLKFPTSANSFIQADLVNISMGNTRIKTNNNIYVTDINKPLLYKGIVKNDTGISSVTVTINNNFTSASILHNNRSISIHTTTDSVESRYYMYNTAEINLPSPGFSCGTKNPLPDEKDLPITYNNNSPFAPGDKCVYVFVDGTYNLYNHFLKDLQRTVNYIYELYNDVGTAYLNEQINIKISEINIWTQTDPFNHNNRDTALHDFAFYYQDNYWGNVGVQLDWSSNISGIAAYIGKVKGELPNNCPGFDPNPPPSGGWWGGAPLCFCDLNYGGNYSNFPVPANSRQVYLIVHEMGHLFDSPHTHWCGWNLGNNTYGALDNCNTTEGGCAMGPAPTNGGTFMSYCIGEGEFVNFNNGFGQRPGDKIRNFISNSSCIPNCPSCTSDAVVGNLGIGANHIEVSNTILANGVVPAGAFSVFDAGNKVTLSPGFNANEGTKLKIIINGCGGQQ